MPNSTDPAVRSRQESKLRGFDAEPSGLAQLRRWAVLLLPLAGIVLCVPLWLATGEWPTSGGGPGPAFFPRLLIGLFAFCMVVRIVQDIRAVRRAVPGEDEDEEALPEEGAELDTALISARRIAIVIAIAVAYVVGTIYLGWVVATFLMVVIFLVLAGKRNLLVVVPLAAVLSLGFAYVFVKVVYLSLPTGVGVFDTVSVRLFELVGAY
jgi:putative tricarboxylic transport membrane protein